MSTRSNYLSSNAIRFLLNEKLITVDDLFPAQSVLTYLRDYQCLTATKESDYEGDCGIYTVVITE